MFVAMGAMLIASLAVPDVFGDDAFLFACAYAFVRIAHLALYAIAGRGDRDLLAAVARLASDRDRSRAPVRRRGARRPAAGRGVGARADLRPARRVRRRRQGLAALGRPLRRAACADRDHRARRVDRRARARGHHELDAGVIVAALLGFAVAAALWWPYFDVVAIVAERKLHELTGNAQLAMARDSYSYLHLPMVAGIILFAVGVKKTLGDVSEPLKLFPRSLSAAGSPSISLAHILFRLRNVRSLNRQRLVVTVDAARPDPRSRSSSQRS